MICSNCGSLLSDNDRFCPNCGTAVVQPDPEPTPDTSAPQSAPDTSAQQSAPDTSAQQGGYAAFTAPDPNPSGSQGYGNQGYGNQGYGNQGSGTTANQGYGSSGNQSYSPFTSTPTFYDVGIQPRDIAVAIILSIVTCGIYNIYWFIKLVDDVNRAANDQSAFSGGVTWLLSLVTGGIYACYWYYQAGKKMAYAKQVRNMPVESNMEILYLVLAIFGLGIVNMALIQSDLNKMATPQN